MEFFTLLPVCVTVCGAYLLFKLRFFFLLHPIRVLKKLADGENLKSSFSSLSLALAGTLGVGNIVGVAVGISVGGAGSVFWLLVSSVFASVIKFSESVISADKGSGIGMIGVIESSFGKKSKLISGIYAALVLMLCFFMGAMLQSASVGQCASLGFSVSPLTVAFIITVWLLPAIIMGSQKIDKITAIVIPMTTIIYIFVASFAIIKNFQRIPSAISMIFSEALSPEGIGGGIFGFFLSAKIREGYLRGLLSNEAGAGTSSFAHSRNPAKDCGSVGVMGICEVLFDTVILCMLTALAVLVSVDNLSGLSGMEIILKSVGAAFGGLSRFLVLVCIFFFAYSTIVCWFYYGSCAFRYLFGRCGRVFTSLFLFSAFFGALTKGDVLITVSDTVLLFLSLISLSALIINSDRIKRLSELSGLLKINRKCRERSFSTRQKNIQEGQRTRLRGLSQNEDEAPRQARK